MSDAPAIVPTQITYCVDPLPVQVKFTSVPANVVSGAGLVITALVAGVPDAVYT